MSMKRNLEIILFDKWNILFLQQNHKGFLVNIFVEPRSQLSMHRLTTTYNVINMRL